MELKLEAEIKEIEKEIKDLALILRNQGEATGVYAVLLGTLQRTLRDIYELFNSISGLDPIEVNLILEKIKVKMLRLDEKVDVLSTFVYEWDEMMA